MVVPRSGLLVHAHARQCSQQSSPLSFPIGSAHAELSLLADRAAGAVKSPMVAAANLVEVAALVGDTARATILAALMGGQALTGSELAYLARVSRFGPGLAHPGARQPCAAVDTWFVGILARALALAVASVGTSALAQDYPTRPVTILVGYTPGATSDLLARTVAERLNAAWGQPVIVDNRSGVGGNIAAAYVVRAPADGYTLMVGTDAIMTSNVFLYKNTPFDPVKDFAPITNAGANIICLAVHVDLPVNSVAELIAYAKAHPGELQYGSSGVGSPHHLAGELLRQKTGIDIVHVPYRG